MNTRSNIYWSSIDLSKVKLPISVHKSLALFVLWIAFVSPSFPQKSYYFDHLTTENGLLANDVFSVFMDSKGYVWIGSLGGLQRFDGYDFLDFTINPDQGMSESVVRNIMETSSGEIWASIRGGGIVRIRDNQLLEPYLHDPTDPNSLSGDYVESIIEDSTGGFWIGTDKGLDYLKDGVFTHYRNDPEDETSLSHDAIYCLLLDDNQNLWVGTEEGLNLHLGKGKFRRFFHSPNEANSLSGNFIHGMAADDLGNIWLAVVLGGINKMSLSDYTIERYMHEPNDPASLGNDIVLDVKYSRKDSSLWVGSWGGGLNHFKDGVFTKYQHVFGDETTIISDNIEELFIDAENNVWIASFGGGVSKLSQRNIISYLYKDYKDKGMFATSSLRAALPTSDGSIWLATHLGVNRFRGDEVQSYYHNPNDDQFGLSSPRAQTIFEDSKGRVWIGYTKAGVDMIKDGKITRFPDVDWSEEYIGVNRIFSICEDTDENIWFSSFGKGLSVYDGEKFTKYTTAQGLIDDRVFLLFPGRDGEVWVATTKGLSRYYKGRFTNYQGNGEPGTLPRNRLRDVVLDGDGNVWVGYVGGISKLDRANGVFQHYDKNDGLGDDIVESLAVDGTGAVWAATNSGLSRYVPEYDAFINYGKENGLLSEQVVHVSYDPWKDQIVIGTPAGFFVMDASNEANAHKANLEITGFVIDSEVDKILPTADVDAITLAPGENSFTINYSTLCGELRPKDRYSYKMSPFDDDWVFAGNKNSLEYTYLDPGIYNLQVKHTTLTGDEQVKSLTIRILPYWWQSWWFKGLIVMALLGLIFLVFRLRVRSTERQKKRLNEEVKRKTDQLKDTQARLIESEKMASVGLLTAGIAHEINNPLNFIHGSSIALEQLLAENLSAAAEKYDPLLNGLKIGVERVDAIVKGLNRFNHQSSGKKEKCDIHLIIDNCLVIVQNDLRDRVTVQKTYMKKKYTLFGFEGELHQVFLNILVNAAQAIEGKGQISISTEIKEQNLLVKIVDTGVGIAQEDLIKVTSPFYTTKPPGSGTGLGMSIGYRIVQDHGGSIKYDSEQGKGTSVTVSLPIE